MHNLPIRFAIPVGLAMSIAAMSASGTDRTWNNHSGDFKWNHTSPNWGDGSTQFATGDNALFTGSGAGTIQLLNSGGSAADVSAGSVTVSGAANYTVGAAQSDGQHLDGKLNASGVLTMNGSGELRLAHGGHTIGDGVNSLAVNNGTVRLVTTLPRRIDPYQDLTVDNSTLLGAVTIEAGATVWTDTAGLRHAIGQNNVNLISKPFGSATLVLNGGTLNARSRYAGNFTAVWDNDVVVTADSTLTWSRTDSANNTLMLRLGSLTFGNIVFTVDPSVGNTGFSMAFNGAVTLSGPATLNVVGSTLTFNQAISDGGAGHDLTRIGAGVWQLANEANAYGDLYLSAGVTRGRDNTVAMGRTVYLGDTTGTADAQFEINNSIYNRALVVRAGSSGQARLGFGSSNNMGFSGTVALEKDVHLVRGASGTASSMTISGAITGDGGVVVDLDPAHARKAVLSGSSANAYNGMTAVLSTTLELGKSGGVVAIPGPLLIGDGAGAGTDTVRLLAANQIADSAPVSIASTGLLHLNGFDDTVGEAMLVPGARIDTANAAQTVHGTLTVPTLIINGVKLPVGATYTRHSIVGAVDFADYVLGEGSIVVLPGPGTLMLVR